MDALAVAASGEHKRKCRGGASVGSSKNPSPLLSRAQGALVAAHERKRQAQTSLEEARRRVDDLERQLDAARRDRAEAERIDREADDAVRRAAEEVGQLELKEPKAWNTMYNMLVAYKEEHGDTLVPHPQRNRPKTALDSLGRWVGNQRVYYSYYMNSGDSKRIDLQRITALERIGFVWNVNEYNWNRLYKRLVKYDAANGHCNVPRKTASRELFNWVNTQRGQWRKHVRGEPSNLTAERISLLRQIPNFFLGVVPVEPKKVGGKEAADDSGADSSTSEMGTPVALAQPTAADAFWERSYDDLVSFHAKHGHCQTKSKTVPKTPALNKLTLWLAQQKREYLQYHEGKPSILNSDRIQRLNNLGLVWRKPPSEPRMAPNTPGPSGKERKRKRQRDE